MKNITCIMIMLLGLCSAPLRAQRVLTLEESKQLALHNNIANKNSRLETRAAQQIRRSARTQYFPSVSAMGFRFAAEKNLMEMTSSGGNLPVYDGDPAHLGTATQFAYFPSTVTGLLKDGTIGNISAIQPLFAGGRIINGNKLAALGQEAATLKENLAHAEVLCKTAELYWQIVALSEKQKTIRKYEEMLTSLLHQVEDAWRSGLIMKNDLLKVQLKRNEILLDKSRLDNGKCLADMAFCHYIGIDYDSTLLLKDEMMMEDDPQSLRVDKAAALRSRGEYALLELSVQAEKLQTRMKRGEFLPQAGVGVAGLYMKLDQGDERTIGVLFGSLSVPLSGWWGGSHQLQERHLQEEMAQNVFRDNSELLLLQMEKAWKDLSDAHKQYLLGKESLEQAEENLKVNEDSYRNGLINLSDLLQAQALLQQAQDQLTEAKANYLVDRGRYLQVTGR
ncbi:MAG TPA: TolC family protein [bacterium]|nr:TolC family protein [bacterium]